MGYKPTVVLDFDGVIHSYISGWKGDMTIIPDPPTIGIKEAIEELRKDYTVVVVSSRCVIPEGIEAIKAWLKKYDIIVDDVVKEKPPAIVYVDDRAICFDGKSDKLVSKVKNFKNWLNK